MSHPEGLRVPEVQVDDIMAAMYDLESKPFPLFRAKQLHLRGWILRQIQKDDERVVRAGQIYPVGAMQYEAVIAYEAMQNAFRGAYEQDLPRVDRRTIITYLQGLCPKSKLHPQTHEPLDTVAPEVSLGIQRDFKVQQPCLAFMQMRRFGDTDAAASGLTLVGMAREVINNQLALPPEM